MRVRPSVLVPLAAAGAFAAVQTASGSPTPPPAGGGIQPALAAAAAELAAEWAVQPEAAGRPVGVGGDGPSLRREAAGRSLRPAATRRPAARTRRPLHRLAVVRGPVLLRDRPGGRARVRVGPRTEFGSPRVLGVARRRGDWLGVVATERPNNRLAWVHRESGALSVRRTRWSLHADLSARMLVLRKAGRRVMRIAVAIGRPGSDTPTGRFAVTDKLSGPSFGPYYGCCILALSGHQPNTPPGWTGGDRLGIHGTNSPSTIGAAASAGCLRAADAPLRVLMRKVPLGTPVFIRR